MEILRSSQMHSLRWVEPKIASAAHDANVSYRRMLFCRMCHSFRPKQHPLTAQCYREQMRQRIQDWQEIVGLKPAA